MVGADKDPNILLAFAYPAGTVAQPSGLKRVGGGILVPDSEQDLLKAAMLRRGVLLSVCAFVGSPDDAAATQEKLKTGEFRVPRETFLMAAAKGLSEQSELFTGTKLDQPLDRLERMIRRGVSNIQCCQYPALVRILPDKLMRLESGEARY